jgi:hypothetical protein
VIPQPKLKSLILTGVKVLTSLRMLLLTTVGPALSVLGLLEIVLRTKSIFGWALVVDMLRETVPGLQKFDLDRARNDRA